MSQYLKSPVMGQMMSQPLLISNLIRHADRYFGDTEIVSRRVEGDIHRYTYRDCHTRARQMANALAKLGVGMGQRVATLAWNGYRHLELYYAISGSGAVMHTVNPRLHRRADRLYPQSRGRPVSVPRHDFPAGGDCHRRKLQNGQRLRDDVRPRPHAGRVQRAKPAVLRRSDRRTIRACSNGRCSTKIPRPACAIPPGLPATRRARCTLTAPPFCMRYLGHARCPEHLGARRGDAGGADVPCECLGFALFGAAWWAQSWCFPAPRWMASRCTS